MYLYFFIPYFIFSFILIYFCNKNNLFIDYKLEKHKRFSSHSKSYSIGGILFLILLIFNYFNFYLSSILLVFFICIFLLGILSDLKYLNSVKLRFLLQFFLIITFVYLLEVSILSTRIEYFDNLLENRFFNIFFVTFCLMVLINGGNFIDGINGLLIKYNLIIFIIILIFFGNHKEVNDLYLISIITVLTFLLLLNYAGLIYMGDSGAYLLSIFTGIFLIKFSYQNSSISPYFVIICLWYPCFELLFSMIRRLNKNNKTYQADTYHLHQIIYLKLKSIIKQKNNLLIHLISSFCINFYNLIMLVFAVNFIYSSLILNFILLFNITIYISIYFILRNKVQIDN